MKKKKLFIFLRGNSTIICFVPERDPHDVGDDEDEGAGDAGLGGEADLRIINVSHHSISHKYLFFKMLACLEGEVPAVVVEPAAQHEGEDVLDRLGAQDPENLRTKFNNFPHHLWEIRTSGR